MTHNNFRKKIKIVNESWGLFTHENVLKLWKCRNAQWPHTKNKNETTRCFCTHTALCTQQLTCSDLTLPKHRCLTLDITLILSYLSVNTFDETAIILILIIPLTPFWYEWGTRAVISQKAKWFIHAKTLLSRVKRGKQISEYFSKFMLPLGQLLRQTLYRQDTSC